MKEREAITEEERRHLEAKWDQTLEGYNDCVLPEDDALNYWTGDLYSREFLDSSLHKHREPDAVNVKELPVHIAQRNEEIISQLLLQEYSDINPSILVDFHNMVATAETVFH